MMMCPLRTNARRQESSSKQTADLSILLDTSYAQQAYTNSQISFLLSKRVSPAGYQQAPQNRSSKGLCPLVQQPSCNKLANSSPCSCLALLQQGYTGKLFIRLSTSEHSSICSFQWNFCTHLHLGMALIESCRIWNTAYKRDILKMVIKISSKTFRRPA